MASPTYDLAVSGITNFARWGRVLSQRKVSRDPLSGIVNATNKLFHTSYYPILTSGSLLVYDGDTQVPGTADYDTGEITLTSVPANQPSATYTFTPYTATQVLQFLMLGFDEMELRWQRGYKLVDSAGNPATESSANIYVADKNGNDPVTNTGVSFSRSHAQVGFLMLCTEFRYYLSQLGEAAIVDYSWRETVKGMSVDKSRVPQNIALALEALDKRLKEALLQAQKDLLGTAVYGGFVAEPVTLDYANNIEWQTASKDGDYRSQLGFHIALRPLTY